LKALVLLAALVTPFRELRDNAAISKNQWGTDKELIKELWRYLQFLNNCRHTAGMTHGMRHPPDCASQVADVAWKSSVGRRWPTD
jgi:hypothetical protein